MKSKRGLMTVLVGVAMLAMPLTAAAKDHGRFHNSQARGFAARHNVGPAAVNRHEFRHQAYLAGAGGRNWNGNHRGWNDGDADDNQNYGNSGYYPSQTYAAPVYAAPVYAAPYGSYARGGNGCNNAQRVMRTYARDRATGHPAAAYDLLRQNQWALHSGCAGGAPVNSGMLGGLGGLGGYGGPPAYNNYGNGGLLGGLGNLGGYRGAPAYGNGAGYNGGYGQPYGSGSMLAPLLQYIR
jgi:hypothetical protein